MSKLYLLRPILSTEAEKEWQKLPLQSSFKGKWCHYFDRIREQLYYAFAVH